MKEPSIENYSHMLGNDLFTKAIISAENDLIFTLPKDGKWIDFFNGNVFDGDTQVSAHYPIDKFPLFIRAGSIIPLNITNNLTGLGNESMVGKTVLSIYPDEDLVITRTLHLPVSTGIDYSDVSILYNPELKVIEAVANTEHDYVFIINNFDMPDDNLVIEGATSWNYEEKAKRLIVEAKGSTVQLSINTIVTGDISPQIKTSSNAKTYSLTGYQVLKNNRNGIVVQKSQKAILKK